MIRIINTLFIFWALLAAPACTSEQKDPGVLVYNGIDPVGDVWTIWSNDSLVSVEPSPEVKAGERSLEIVYPDVEPRGYQDWSLESKARLVEVKPGEEWTASAWIKYEKTERAGLEILALSGGKPVGGWTSGLAAAYGTGDWELLEASAIIPPGCDHIRVRLTGSGRTHAWVDEVRLRRGLAVREKPDKPAVRGWAFDRDRIAEKLDRGVVAVPSGNGSVHVSWRLLAGDPDDIAFDIYRAAGEGELVKLNTAPVSATTDFLDKTAGAGTVNTYQVRSLAGGRETGRDGEYVLAANTAGRNYISIKLDSGATFQKVGVGDLNGDGKYDFVIKTPNANIDPYHGKRRVGGITYKLEAYLSDGTFLWRKDLGWNIESGIWYSPYLVYDLDGDGRAEVALKTGPQDKDYRERGPDAYGLYSAGRVTSGPEYLSVLDGMTGKEKARVDWPSRQGLGSYNHYSRNMIGLAYLDGKTPCLVAARGTYTVNKLETYQYDGKKLDELWKWDSTEEPGGRFYGQGGHFMHTVDVNGDERDDIVIGAAVVGSNGDGLWSSGLGHSDNMWVADIDPARPGLEIYLGMEGARVKGSVRNGISLRDAASGELLWGLDRRTYHVHSSGLVSDIDLRHPGLETYSGESGRPDRWLHAAGGELLADQTAFDEGLKPRAVYWDASAERELLVENRLFRYPDETISDDIEGDQVAWLDLFGDWREEIITTVPGELRIYTTPVPATDRRISLMQDPLYRSDVAHVSMGYGQPPQTSFNLNMPRH